MRLASFSFYKNIRGFMKGWRPGGNS